VLSSQNVIVAEAADRSTLEIRRRLSCTVKGSTTQPVATLGLGRKYRFTRVYFEIVFYLWLQSKRIAHAAKYIGLLWFAAFDFMPNHAG
jgi:hypothetical protein